MRLPFQRKAAGSLFVHPLHPAPKTIVLSPGFQSTRSIRVFPKGWSEEAARFGPCSVAATLPELRQLARAGIELRHAAVVLTRGVDSALEENDRDLLWRAFGVPVFEQCLSAENEVLASECEAHDGLHVTSPGRGMSLETNVCGCGSSVPRLMPAAQTHVPQVALALVS